MGDMTETTRSAKETTIAVAVFGSLLIAVGTIAAAVALPDVGDGINAPSPGDPVAHLVGLMVAGVGSLLLTVAVVAAGVSLGMRMSSHG